MYVGCWPTGSINTEGAAWPRVLPVQFCQLCGLMEGCWARQLLRSSPFLRISNSKQRFSQFSVVCHLLTLSPWTSLSLLKWLGKPEGSHSFSTLSPSVHEPALTSVTVCWCHSSCHLVSAPGRAVGHLPICTSHLRITYTQGLCKGLAYTSWFPPPQVSKTGIYTWSDFMILLTDWTVRDILSVGHGVPRHRCYICVASEPHIMFHGTDYQQSPTVL